MSDVERMDPMAVLLFRCLLQALTRPELGTEAIRGDDFAFALPRVPEGLQPGAVWTKGAVLWVTQGRALRAS